MIVASTHSATTFLNRQIGVITVPEQASSVHARSLTTHLVAPVRLRAEDHDARPNIRGRAMAVALDPRPRLSWIVRAQRPGHQQTGYQIVASTSGDPRRSADLWDSGRVASADNAHVRWAGPPLLPHSTLRWTVRVWDENGDVSLWAEPVELVAGPFRPSDWTASWIDIPSGHAARTTFTLPSAVVQARLHLAGHGLLRALIDGVAVNPDAMDPSSTALSRVAVRSYDVTAELSAGRHVLALAAGTGHYGHALSNIRALAEIVAELADGTVLQVVSDGSWTHGPTSVVADVPFHLEEHDARIDDSWARSDFSGQWPLVDTPEVDVDIVPDAGPPVTVVQEIAADRLDPAGFVFDVGRNVAARSRVTVTGAAAGTRIVVVHGEKVNTDGQVDTTNIRLPWDRDVERQLVAWTCAGGVDVIEPWFAVHGFRYVEVRGVPAGVGVTVTARVLHSDIARTGTFTSDDPKLDQLVGMAVNGQRNNTHGHPEDCPTREQAGWTGDASVSAEAALNHLDMAGVYRNWLRDVVADQRSDGGILGLTPALLGKLDIQPADPVWGAAMTEIPWQQWWQNGDLDLVMEHLPAMRRWCDWQVATLDGGVVRKAGISFGADWLAPERTPAVILQTAAVIRSLLALADMERAAGHEERALARSGQADALRGSATEMLADPVTGNWANGAQGAFAVAMAAKLVDSEESVVDRIRVDMHGRGDRVSTGFSATQALVRGLGSSTDGCRALLNAVHQSAQPGIGSMLVDGPGTFWETWWIDDDNAGVASLNHIGLAAPFAAWVWTQVAGLAPTSPGFRTFRLAPWFTGPLRHINFTRDTVRGQIAFDGRLEDGVLTATVDVPTGSTAQLVVPGANLRVEGSAGTDFAGTEVVKDHLELPSGRYRVTAEHVAAQTQRPAIGALDDVLATAGQSAPVLLPHGDWTVTADDGWTAELAEGHVHVRPPVNAAPGDTAELTVTDGDRSARRVARVVRQGGWLTTGDGSWRIDNGDVRSVAGPYECVPVWHGPIPGDIIEVTTPPLAAGETGWVKLSLPEPTDLSDARFLSAELDLCFPDLPGHRLIPVLRLRADDGTQRTATIRPLPVCWNRISVDVSDWPARSAIVEIAVGLTWYDQPESARGGYRRSDIARTPLHVRVGDVRWTSAPRIF